MSMEKFIESLSDEQRESLKKILGDKDGDDTDAIMNSCREREKIQALGWAGIDTEVPTSVL